MSHEEGIMSIMCGPSTALTNTSIIVSEEGRAARLPPVPFKVPIRYC